MDGGCPPTGCGGGRRPSLSMEYTTDAPPPALHPSTGHSAGYIRVELQELQGADRGRKYGVKDRRPLDPPPVVQLRLHRTIDIGGNNLVEREIEDYRDVQVSGLICHIDAYPWPETPQGAGTQITIPSDETRQNTSLSAQHTSFTWRTAVRPAHPVPPTLDDLPAFRQPERPDPDPVLAVINGLAIRESHSVTTDIVGTRAVEAQIITHEAQYIIVFVFADLAMKREGNFLFRYRAFDLLSPNKEHMVAEGRAPIPMLAECFSR
ncbi:hypothetical protein PUNSTDRAFT_120708, partial [Punctularia strigosozonata HHB-11173 SS5]|uniref:uncharacterized protein n=1 Tax=Punctularia strigosozonata (strain HHB-11173) TaxID=741275 RepID=UPI0004416D97